MVLLHWPSCVHMNNLHELDPPGCMSTAALSSWSPHPSPVHCMLPQWRRVLHAVQCAVALWPPVQLLPASTALSLQ